MSNDNRQLQAIILAAGKGTRMNSDLPKVLHPVADRPMVSWVLDAVEAVGVSRTVVIIGFGGDQVRAALADRRNLEFVEQTDQLGTGHAVSQAAPLFADGGAENTDVLVLCGDGPMIQPKTLHRLVESHRAVSAAATLATSVLPDATGYGRILRSRHGRFLRIVEHKDAQPSELQIREVNPSIYCLDAQALFDTLPKVGNHNAKGEYYLTDVFELLMSAGRTVHVVEAVPPEDVLSINTPEELSRVDALLRQRLGQMGGQTGPTLPGGETFA